MTTEGTATEAVLGSGPMNAASPTPAQEPVRQHRHHPLLSILISPVHPSTWAAVASVIVGFAVAVLAFSVVTTLFSTGAGLLILIVGIPIVGLGMEAARLTARAERWRMSLTDDRPLVARPYRPLDPNPSAPLETRIRTWAEAEFLDSSRWLDVVYVALLLPLAVIEFTIMVTLWATAVGFILTPLALAWTRAVPDRLHSWSGPFTPEGATAILFVLGRSCFRSPPTPPAAWSRSIARWSRGCCASTRPRPCGATTIGSAAVAPRRSSWRRASCAASSGTSTTLPSSAW